LISDGVWKDMIVFGEMGDLKLSGLFWDSTGRQPWQ
jgi:hypothetical protein